MQQPLWRIARVAGALIGVGLGIYFGYLERRSHRAGDGCSGRVGERLDAHTMLTCRDGVFVAVPCPGPGGVHEHDDKLTCDYSTAKDGDACPGKDEATCDGASTRVNCKNGVVQRESCRGPEGCNVYDANYVFCDSSLAQVGDPCKDGWACSPDHQAALECRDGKMALASSCHGPKGCGARDHQVTCDSSIVELGEPCSTPREGGCSRDGGSILGCREGTFVVMHVCRGPQKCATKDHQPDCDMVLAEAGDPCEGEVAACTPDGKTFLRCKSGAYAVDSHCTRCFAEGEKILCR